MFCKTLFDMEALTHIYFTISQIFNFINTNRQVFHLLYYIYNFEPTL